MFNGASLLILIALVASVWWLIFEVRYSRSVYSAAGFQDREAGVDHVDNGHYRGEPGLDVGDLVPHRSLLDAVEGFKSGVGSVEDAVNVIHDFSHKAKANGSSE